MTKTDSRIKCVAACLIMTITAAAMAACGKQNKTDINLLEPEEPEQKIVNLFGPMEKTNPDADNVARSAFD